MLLYDHGMVFFYFTRGAFPISLLKHSFVRGGGRERLLRDMRILTHSSVTEKFHIFMNFINLRFKARTDVFLSQVGMGTTSYCLRALRYLKIHSRGY